MFRAGGHRLAGFTGFPSVKREHYIFVSLAERRCPSRPCCVRCAALLCITMIAFAACRTAPLAPVDLKEPGWIVREGQAIWRRNKEAPEIAGELLVATRDGMRFIQFTKTPFPMIVARSTTNRWQIE